MARECGVTVVPMWVTIGGRQYRDDDVSLQEIIAETVDRISTSGPAPGELARAVEMADTGEGALVLTVSRKMSAVYDAARLASQPGFKHGFGFNFGGTGGRGVVAAQERSELAIMVFFVFDDVVEDGDGAFVA